MAVPFTQQATEAVYIHSKEIADLISTNVAIIGVLGAKGSIEIIEGGLGWRERVFYGSSPNSGHRPRYAQIPTTRMENMTMAQYDGAFWSDAVVVNKVDVAEAKGESALGDLVEDSWKIAKASYVDNIADALWASSRASANDPIPLAVMFPATLPASQTGTDRGGIDSAVNTWWRSQAYTTAIGDLGAVAGLRTLQQELAKASRSTAKAARPNFALTTSAIFSRITSTMDANRRYTDEDTTKLGFKHVLFEDMITLWDAKCTAKYFYYMNTNKMKIKCLRMPKMQNIVVNGNQYSLPIVIEPMRDDIDTINYISLMYLKYQLVTNDLSSGGILSNCTE